MTLNPQERHRQGPDQNKLDPDLDSNQADGGQPESNPDTQNNFDPSYFGRFNLGKSEKKEAKLDSQNRLVKVARMVLKKSRYMVPLAVVGTAAVTLIPGMLSPNNISTPDEGSEPVPSEPETPAQPEAPINLETNTYTISPESLEGLTSEEMTERFTIPVVSESGDITTPEDFAQHYVENMEGLYNAGSGASDLEANQDLSLTEHMDATGAKYDNPIISGIFAEGVNSDLPREIHTGHAQNALISSLFGDTDVPYRVDFELESSITTQSPAIPGDGFTVEIVYVAKNNLIESGVFDFFKGTGKDQIPLDERIVSTVTVIPQNGALKVKDSESSRF